MAQNIYDNETFFSAYRALRREKSYNDLLEQPAMERLLPEVEMVLVMSVEPGFGGQSFIPSSVEKVRRLEEMKRRMGLDTLIEVDGGISARNAREVFEAGADALVAGSAVFGAPDPEAEIVRMLEA